MGKIVTLLDFYSPCQINLYVYEDGSVRYETYVKCVPGLNQPRSPAVRITKHDGATQNPLIKTIYVLMNENLCCFVSLIFTISSKENASCRYWTPGSLYTPGKGHIWQSDCIFMWVKLLSIDHILWRIFPSKAIFAIANMLKFYCQGCVNEWLWDSKYTSLFIPYVLEPRDFNRGCINL